LLTLCTCTVDPSWKEDSTQDEIWGVDETEYWANISNDAKTSKNDERPPQPHQLPITSSQPIIINYAPADIDDCDPLKDIRQLQGKPRPATVTAKNPNTKMDVENKRRLFRNLHKQLSEELGIAKQLGTLGPATEKFVNEATDFATKHVECWEDLDINMMEPRVREIVRELIIKRQVFIKERDQFRKK
jgi:hypothetical protein